MSNTLVAHCAGERREQRQTIQVTDLPTLDLREQILRIDRAIAETQKFQAEGSKLKADQWFAPFIATGTFVAAVGGL